MEDISALLGLLSSASSSENKEDGDRKSAEDNSDGGFFGNIDPEMLIKLVDIFSRLNESDKNSQLILAIKPHLKKENQPKADKAAELMKLFTVLSALKDENIF